MIFKDTGLFKNKGRERVDADLRQYVKLIGATVREFHKMVVDYMAEDKVFKEETRHLHDMESEADAVRRNIERELYEGAMLPAWREDWIGLVETLDRVANKGEEAGDFVYLVRPQVPKMLREGMCEMARLTEDCWLPVSKMVDKLIDEDTDVGDLVRETQQIEGAVDKLQFRLTRQVFKELKTIDRVDQLILMQLIEKLANVSDRIENVADRVAIIAIKRQF